MVEVNGDGGYGWPYPRSRAPVPDDSPYSVESGLVEMQRLLKERRLKELGVAACST